MRLIIAWVVGSLLIGYLGRNRRAGFWGNLFFSLILSPIVGALALIMAAPSSKQKQQQKQEVRKAKAAAAAAAVHHPAEQSAARASALSVFRSFAVPWLAVVAVFAVAYSFTTPLATAVSATSVNQSSPTIDSNANPYAGPNFQRGVVLSLDTGTFGLGGLSSTGEGNSVHVLMAIQRLATLLILAMAMIRVLLKVSESRIKQMHGTLGDTVTALEATNRAQQQELDRLRAIVAQAPTPRAEPAATASATVSH